MGTLDYLVILAYFIGLIAVSVIMSRKIRSSEDMFLAGRNSSWWLSGISSYMTIFSASTFVVWGGVAYKSGLVAIFHFTSVSCISVISIPVMPYGCTQLPAFRYRLPSAGSLGRWECPAAR